MTSSECFNPRLRTGGDRVAVSVDFAALQFQFDVEAGMVGVKALGMGISSLAPLAGPLAPVVFATGKAVEWLGPAAIAALPSYGGIRDEQILNDPSLEDSSKAIAAATMGAAVVGAIEVAFGPQQWPCLL